MFRRLDDRGAGHVVRIRFEGREIDARTGDSLAAALLAAGETAFGRSVVHGDPRGPHCLIGNCFECLLQVDGVAGIQACRTTVRQGMDVRRQPGGAAPGGFATGEVVDG